MGNQVVMNQDERTDHVKAKLIRGLVYGSLFGVALVVIIWETEMGTFNAVSWLLAVPFYLTAMFISSGEVGLAVWPYVCIVYYGFVGGLAGCAWGLGTRPRRHAPGCCRDCGYDLTGNVSGVCPECGRDMDRPVKRYYEGDS